MNRFIESIGEDSQMTVTTPADARDYPATVVGYELATAAHGELRERELGHPGPRQVVIRVRMTGVCASELHDWVEPPERFVPVGHEPVGEIVAVGSDTALRVGQWVTGRVLRAFAPYLVADETDLAVVPVGLDLSSVLGEPVGCVVEGLRRTNVPAGATVAVIGVGFMGLVMVQLLARSLASSVVAIDPRSDAREAALANGADAALSPDEVAQRSEAFDVVIEASGSAPGLELATRLVRVQGILSILGYHRAPRTVDMELWNQKALEVVNAHVQDRDLLRRAVQVGLDLAASGRIDPARLITHRFGADAIDEAYATLRDKPDGFIKAVIDY